MKTKILNLAAIMLFLIGSSSSCEKENFTTLPPETQTGANTFGCYINGELFVASSKYAPWGHSHIGAGYLRGMKLLTFGGYGKSGVLGIEIIDPKEGVYMKMTRASFVPNDEWGRDCFLFGGKEIGEITLTKLDTVNCIVSGRFKFQGKCSDPLFNITGDSTVNITEGRFDIKLEISQ
jgi:hypothetical protein